MFSAWDILDLVLRMVTSFILQILSQKVMSAERSSLATQSNIDFSLYIFLYYNTIIVFLIAAFIIGNYTIISFLSSLSFFSLPPLPSLPLPSLLPFIYLLIYLLTC